MGKIYIYAKYMNYTEWRERCNKKNPALRNLRLTVINNEITLDKITLESHHKLRKTVKPIKFNLSEFKKIYSK